MRKYLFGFTLVELMIVIVIFGILAAIGIPSFQRYQNGEGFSMKEGDSYSIKHDHKRYDCN